MVRPDADGLLGGLGGDGDAELRVCMAKYQGNFMRVYRSGGLWGSITWEVRIE